MPALLRRQLRRGGFKTLKVTRSVSKDVEMSSVKSPLFTLRIGFETASKLAERAGFSSSFRLGFEFNEPLGQGI